MLTLFIFIKVSLIFSWRLFCITSIIGTDRSFGSVCSTSAKAWTILDRSLCYFIFEKIQIK